MQCLLSATIMWKISTHMMPTCCPAPFYEGHSCDTETHLFKGSCDVCGRGRCVRRSRVGVIQTSLNRNKVDLNPFIFKEAVTLLQFNLLKFLQNMLGLHLPLCFLLCIHSLNKVTRYVIFIMWMILGNVTLK